MTSLSLPDSLDLSAVKRGQQQMWASGDYGAVAAMIHLVAERLVDSVDPAAGSAVLDVAGGTGNAAIAAARSGTRVTCTDYVPELLERGRERASAERLDILFEPADAEALPYADASYDVVLSVFGAMFAPDQESTAAELVRVTRPGGRSGSPRGRPRASSASGSARRAPTWRPRPGSPRRCAGAARRASPSCSATA